MHRLDQLDIRHLRIFLVLLAQRNVTRTSVLLGVSQPAVTQLLNKFRTLFSDPILIRSQRSMVPTELALRLEVEIRSFLDALDLAQGRQADFDPTRVSRELVVTASEYLELLLFPQVLSRMRRQAPGIQLRVRPPEPQTVCEQMALGQIDFRFGWVREAVPAFRCLPLFEDRIVVIAGRRHSCLDQNISLTELVRLPHVRLVGNGRTTSGRVVDEFLLRHGARVHVQAHVQGLMALLQTLDLSDAIATVPLRMAQAVNACLPLKILHFPGDLPNVYNALYWHERTHRSPLHRWFRAFVTDLAKEFDVKPSASFLREARQAALA